MYFLHIPFFYDCFRPSEERIYQLPPMNLNSIQANLSTTTSSYSSSIFPTSGNMVRLIIDFTTTWSVVVESKIITDSETPLTTIQLSPLVRYVVSETTEISEVVSTCPPIILLEGIDFIIAINYITYI